MGDMFGGAPTPVDPGTITMPQAGTLPFMNPVSSGPLDFLGGGGGGGLGGVIGALTGSGNGGMFPSTAPTQTPQGGLGGVLDILGKGTGLLSTIMALKGAFTQSPYEKLGENMISASNKALKAYTSGKLTTTQQAAVDQFKRQEMARWQQYLASVGIPASSAMVDIQNKIDRDAQVYANQLLQQDFNNALQAMQTGGQVDAASQAALSRVGQATNRLP